jgi:diguanylate cyclase (GGDEF)-like protein
MTTNNPANFTEIELALKTANNLLDSEPQRAYSLGKQLSDQIQQIEHKTNTVLFAKIQLLQAECLYQFGNHQASLEIIDFSLNLFEKFKQEIFQVKTLILLSKILNQQNQYSAAMDHLIKALAICHRLDQPALLADILFYKAIVHLSVENAKQALIELNKCFQIFYHENDLEKQHTTHCLFAWAYKLENDLENAKIHQNKCTGKLLKNVFLYAINLYLRGDVEVHSGNMENAKEAFLESIKVSEQHGFKLIRLNALTRYADLIYQQQNLPEALHYASDALEKAQSLSYQNGLLRSHHTLALIYETKQDFQKAYVHLKAYLHIYHLINQEKTKLKLKTIENVYQNKSLQNEARIIEQKNQQLEQEIKEREWVEKALRASEENYRQLANLDPLTNLFNRRYFYELAINEIVRSNRYNNPLSLLMIDIDHFKTINDQFGHQIGDEVLQWMTGKIKEMLRDVDITARYGGEEFIILLPETDRKNAKIAAERLRLFFVQTPFHKSDPAIHITLSIGMAVLRNNEKLDNFINRCDQALYQAKNNGRNCISEIN